MPETEITHWKWAFAHEPRELQIEALDRIFAAQDDVILLDAPTGIGKSAILMTAVNTGGGTVVTSQKSLQDQYTSDWPEIPVLKGAANYQCTSHGAGSCKAAKGAKLCGVRNGCPYHDAREDFVQSYQNITNYAYFFSTRDERVRCNPDWHWLCLDEAHSFEDAVMGNISVDIRREDCQLISLAYSTPDSLDEALERMQRFYDKAGEWVAQVEGVITQGHADAGTISRFNTIKDLREKITELLDGDEENLILEPSSSEFSVKPLYAAERIQKYLHSAGRRVLLSSATLPPNKILSKTLGIATDLRIELPSPFDVQNRRVIFDDVAAVSNATLPKDIVKLAKKVVAIAREYKKDKGIIHTPSFRFSGMLYDLLPADVQDRVILQDRDSDRSEIVRRHMESEEPTIIMSPGMYDGLDLKGKLSRFTIIPKVPYAGLGSPWVRARMEDFPAWYDWTAMQNIIQGVGRSVRSENDWADAYILDSNFDRLWRQCRKMTPKWFMECFS